MVAEGASDAIFVASGQYTREAWQFARDNGLTLFDGSKLVELIDFVRGDAAAPSAAPVFKPAIPVLISLAIIVGALWLGNPQPDHHTITVGSLSSVPGQPDRAAIETKNRQEIDAQVQHEQMAAHARKLFESSYQAPNGCENWKTSQKMLECGNDRVRAKRLFLSKHSEFAALSVIDLQ
jgi:hypothetical protein